MKVIYVEYFFQYLLSPILIIIIGKWIDYKAEKNRERRAEEKAQELAKEQQIIAAINAIVTKIDTLTQGELCLLRNRILDLCKYHINIGTISTLELENLSKMHDAYKQLGGNGLCDHLFESVQDLPLEQ